MERSGETDFNWVKSMIARKFSVPHKSDYQPRQYFDEVIRLGTREFQSTVVFQARLMTSGRWEFCDRFDWRESNFVICFS